MLIARLKSRGMDSDDEGQKQEEKAGIVGCVGCGVVVGSLTRASEWGTSRQGKKIMDRTHSEHHRTLFPQFLRGLQIVIWRTSRRVLNRGCEEEA